MIRRLNTWLQEEFKAFAIVWLGSLTLVWLFTRNIRLALCFLLILCAIAMVKKIAREILLVSFLAIIPLGMIFSGMDVFTTILISLCGGLVLTLLVHLKTLPSSFSASLYVPAIAISLIVAETL